MEKQKTRSEIEEQYKWDLTTIYKSDELWYEDLEKISKEVDKISEFRGNVVNNASNLLKYLKFDDELERMGIQEGDIVRIMDYEFEYTK